ncbi:MAG: cysteine desulfurase [Actinobacteria bacterium]|nr:cysteine desulfurase [Actinomycetota bacterium]
MSSLGPHALRADFPTLRLEVHGRPLVYLDNAATSQKPQAVIDVIRGYYEATNANIHRGIHHLSEKATAEFESARVKLARFINAERAHEIIFTRGTTESINLVARSWGDANVCAGDEILLTEIEHHSNLVPWQMLAQRRGAKLRFIPSDRAGRIDLEAYRRLFSPRTKIVAVTHMSNVLGVITPAAELVRIAHEHGVAILLDAAQSVPHLPVDVQALDADFLAFSGHKMLGPTGIGVLYGKEALLDRMEPLFGGGSMIRVVQLESSTWADLPAKFEGGTPHIEGAIGLGAAVDYLSTLGMEAVRQHELELTGYALRQLGDLDGVELYGPESPAERGGVMSFNIGAIHPHDVGTVLDGEGIAVRAGHHCAQPLMRKLGISATARASFYLYNTREEVDQLVTGIERVKAFFGNGQPPR